MLQSSKSIMSTTHYDELRRTLDRYLVEWQDLHADAEQTCHAWALCEFRSMASGDCQRRVEIKERVKDNVRMLGKRVDSFNIDVSTIIAITTGTQSEEISKPVVANLDLITSRRLETLSYDLQMPSATLLAVIKILKRKTHFSEDIGETLRDIAIHHQALRSSLDAFVSLDPELGSLKRGARDALGTGNLDRTRRLLREASEREIVAFRGQERNVVRGLSAAQSRVELGNLSWMQLDYVQASTLYRQATELLPDGPDRVLADFLTLWGLAAKAAGQYDQAEMPLKQALRVRETAFGSEDPRVATALNNLALLYFKQGRYNEAESLYKRALAVVEATSGPTHSNVGTLLYNLARLYAEAGRAAEAASIYRRVLEIQEVLLGRNHQDVAKTLSELAGIYRNRGRDIEAERLYRRALEIREGVFGKYHPDVARTLGDLAAIYQRRGRDTEAERLYQRALIIREQVLGPGHLDVSRTLTKLAFLYQNQGRDSEAEPLYRRALQIQQANLGSNHPDVAIALNNLAALYHDAGGYAEAEPLYRQAVKIAKESQDLSNPNVLGIVKNYARFLRVLNRDAEAQRLERQFKMSRR